MAVFDDLLANPDLPRAYLFLATPYDPATSAETEVRFSTGLTFPILDNKTWPARLTVVLNHQIDLFSRGIGGGSEPGFGDIQIASGDGAFDYLLDYSWDGRDVTVLMGPPDGSFSDFGVLHKGTARDIVWQRGQIVIRMRDFSHLLNVPAQTTTYAGTGTYEGTEDLFGAKKPLAFGVLRNVQPVLIDPALDVYQLHERVIQSVDGVYDRSIPLVSAGNVSDVYAWTPVGGRYVTDLSRGVIRLGAPADGPLTVDFKGDASGGYVEDAMDVLTRLITWKAGMAADLDTASISALDAARPWPIGVYIVDDETIFSVCDQILQAVGGWWTWTPQRKLVVGLIEIDTPAAAFDTTDIVSLESLDLDPPVWNRRIGYARAWHAQPQSQSGRPIARDTENVGGVPVDTILDDIETALAGGWTIAEILDQMSGQIDETQLAQDLLDRINLIDGPESLTNSVAARLAQEAADRAAAIAQEAADRAAALAQEAADRAAAISDEADERAAAITAEANTRTAAIAAEAAARATALANEAAARAADIKATIEKLAAALIDGGESGVVYSNTPPANTALIWIDTSGPLPVVKIWDGNSWEIDPTASIKAVAGANQSNASAITAATARIDNLEGTQTSHASSITSLTSRIGAAESVNSTQATAITNLTTRVTNAENTNTSQATSITNLTTRVGAAESVNSAQGTAISALDTRVSNAEGTLTSHSSSITSLTSRIGAAEGVNSTQATAITGLTTRVTNAEGQLSSQSQSITSLESNIGEIGIWEDDYVVSETTVLPLRKANGVAPLAHGGGSGSSRISYTVEGTTQSTSTATGYISRFYYTGSAWAVDHIRRGSASNGPDFHIDADGNPAVKLFSHTSHYAVRVKITKHNSYQTPYSVNATAIQTLETRVSDNEGTLTSQASAITSLTSRIGNVEGVNSTQATAISGLTTRVTSAEGTISSHTSSITSLTSRIGAAEGVNNTQATAISNLTTDVSNINNTLTAQSNSITALRSDLGEVGIWEQAYLVTTASGAKLQNADETVPLKTAYNAAATRIAYTVEGVTNVSVGTIDVGSAARFLYNGTAWTIDEVRVGADSRAPRFYLDANGHPAVRLNGHTSQFSVYVKTTKHGTSVPAEWVNATAINSLETRVSNAEGTLTSQASSITSLTSRIGAAEGVNSTQATAISGLTTRVTNAEGALASQATSIDVLEASTRRAALNHRNSNFEEGILGWGSNTPAGTEIAAQWNPSPTTVEILEGQGKNGGRVLRAHGYRAIYAVKPIPVDITRTYRVRVTVRRVTAPTSGTGPFYAGVTNLQPDFTYSSSGNINSYCAANAVVGSLPDDGQWREFSGLIKGVGTGNTQFRPGTAWVRPMALLNYAATGGVMDIDELVLEDVTDEEAAGTAIQSLETRVSAAEGTLSSHSTSITSLTSRIGAAEGVNSSQATAISGLNTTVSNIQGTLTSQAGSITSLQSSLTATNERIDDSERWRVVLTNVTASAPVRIPDADGTSLSMGGGRAYNNQGRVSIYAEARGLNITGSSSPLAATSTIARIQFNGSVWTVETLYSMSNSSGHPQFVIANAGWPSITHATDTPIDVEVLLERHYSHNDPIHLNSTAIQSLETRTTSIEGTLDTQATAITSLTSRIGAAEGVNNTQATAINSLTTRVTAVEGVNTSQASSITSLTSRMTAVEGVNSTQATAISSLTTRVTNAENTISSQASSITSLQASYDGVQRWTRYYGVSTSSAERLKNADGSYLSSGNSGGGDRASFIVQGRVTGTGTATGASARFVYNSSTWTMEHLYRRGATSNHPEFFLDSNGNPAVRLYGHSSTYTVEVIHERHLVEQDPIRLNSTAISGLEVRVTDAEGVLTTQASSITSLTSRMGAVESTNSTQATAINNLTTRVTAVEGVNTSQASSITSLNSRMTAVENTNSSQATALTSLTTRVTNAENVNTSQASSITTLSTTVGNHTTTISQQATSINGLQAQYTVKIDNNGQVAGFGLSSAPTGTGGVSSHFIVRVDRFAVGPSGGSNVYPFIVSGGNVIIDRAFIRDLTADEISVGYDGGNLVTNPGAEGNTAAGWITYGSASITPYTTQKVSGHYSFRLNSNASYAIFKAFPVRPGETLATRIYFRGYNQSSANGFYFRLYFRTTPPPTGYIGGNGGNHDVYNAGLVDVAPANSAISTAWGSYDKTVTVPSGAYWCSVAVYNWTAGPSNGLLFDDVEVRRPIRGVHITDDSITAPKIKAGEIEGDHLKADTVIGKRVFLGTATNGSSVELSGASASNPYIGIRHSNGQWAFLAQATGPRVLMRRSNGTTLLDLNGDSLTFGNDLIVTGNIVDNAVTIGATAYTHAAYTSPATNNGYVREDGNYDTVQTINVAAGEGAVTMWCQMRIQADFFGVGSSNPGQQTLTVRVRRASDNAIVFGPAQMYQVRSKVIELQFSTERFLLNSESFLSFSLNTTGSGNFYLEVTASDNDIVGFKPYNRGMTYIRTKR